MSIFLGNSEPSKIFVGDTEVSAVYVGDTKVRPSIQPITTAGIYHSSDLGLISISSDGSTWTTIADKNLGATVVYHDGDALSESNCGYYYQWGNNHPYPFTGTVTTSSTRVNPTGYGPGTVNGYWSNSTYITGTNGWMTTYVADLRGATTDTNTAKQGPCAAGYHIPSDTEWDDLVSIGVTISAWTMSNGTNIKNYLLMPYADKRWYDGSIYSQGNNGIYRTANANNRIYAKGFTFHGSSISSGTGYNNEGRCIRPFYNTSVQPDTTRTVLYQ